MNFCVNLDTFSMWTNNRWRYSLCLFEYISARESSHTWIRQLSIGYRCIHWSFINMSKSSSIRHIRLSTDIEKCRSKDTSRPIEM